MKDRFRFAPLLALMAMPAAAQTTSTSTGEVVSRQSSPTSSVSLANTQIPADLRLLIGKRILVGRLPLCVPKTYTVNLSFAGKAAKVLSFKQNEGLKPALASLTNLPANVRAMLEDQSNGGVMSFQFEDGTVLDTCAGLAVSALAPNLDLAPGELITLPVGAETVVKSARDSVSFAPASRAGLPAQQCPIVITRASSGQSFGHSLLDALTTSEFQRQLDEAGHGGAGKHYLDVQIRNNGQKPIKAFEFAAVYANRMGDDTTSAAYVSQNTQSIKPGASYKVSAMDRTQSSQNGLGDVRVFVSRIRFDDDTTWQDDGSRSCFQSAASK